jgi:hypothetical protein
VLVYLIERPNGTVELLKPSEFQQRVSAATKTTAAAKPSQTSRVAEG